MKTRTMRKIAVLVTGSALALSFPAASSFGDPPSNGNHHCGNSVGKGEGPKDNTHRKALNNNGKGWKCGLHKHHTDAGAVLA